MRKTFVLDTDVLMKYPESPFGFADNEVVVTATTVETLSALEDAYGEKGRQAREASRKLKEIRELAERQGESLAEGVKINKGKGLFRIENDCIKEENLPQYWKMADPRNRILSATRELGAILVSEGAVMGVKASMIGVPVQNYKNAQLKTDDEYTGHSEAYVTADVIAEVNKNGSAKADMRTAKKFVENEYLILRDAANPKHTTLARYKEGRYLKLVGLSGSCKVSPKNVAQHFALDALLSDDVSLVILMGEAGTAKTFLSITAGMDGMFSKWDQIIATRSNVDFDSDGSSNKLGALPGDETEKVGPLLRGITDNLKTYLRIQGTADEDLEMTIDDYLETKRISVESMTFMRGRSITDAMLIIDEAQNTTPRQIFGIVTRQSDGGTEKTRPSKIVICGDPHQIDDPKLDYERCGLTFAAEKMRGSLHAAFVKFGPEDNYRSAMSRDAIERMQEYFE